MEYELIEINLSLSKFGSLQNSMIVTSRQEYKNTLGHK